MKGKQTEGLGLEDFTAVNDENGTLKSMTCPSGQEAVVQAGRKAQRYTCAFDDTVCRGCPLRDQCPTKQLKRKPLRILRFSLVDLRIAKQRHDVATSGKEKNIRAAVESTVRSVIHPFGGHLCKLPVRGMVRVTHMIILSAAMVNVRRIASYVASTLEICLNT